MSNLTATIIAVPISALAWAVFMATPATIEKTSFDKQAYAPGDRFIVVSIGKKSKWAPKLCTAEDAKLYLTDSSGFLAEFNVSKDYNYGSIKKIRYEKKIPTTFSPGPATGWESVTYECFGFHKITTYSHERGTFAVTTDSRIKYDQ